MRKDRDSRLSAYLLPNLITTGNLFWGFFSIVKSLQGHYAWAASALFLAAIFDMLDGRVARMTGGTSEFGVQYDSLCDLVSFGLAPAFLAFQFGLNGAGRFGWICCFIFLACGALRLARFNVLSSKKSTSEDFVGLPIPMAAMVIGSFVLFFEEMSASADGNQLTVAIQNVLAWQGVKVYTLIGLTLLAAVAMVSNVRYFSHKSMNFGKSRPFQLLTLIVVLIALIAYQPETFALILAVGYALSGPLDYLLGRKSVDEKEDEIFGEMNDDDEGRGDSGKSESKAEAARNHSGVSSSSHSTGPEASHQSTAAQAMSSGPLAKVAKIHPQNQVQNPAQGATLNQVPSQGQQQEGKGRLQ